MINRRKMNKKLIRSIRRKDNSCKISIPHIRLIGKIMKTVNEFHIYLSTYLNVFYIGHHSFIFVSTSYLSLDAASVLFLYFYYMISDGFYFVSSERLLLSKWSTLYYSLRYFPIYSVRSTKSFMFDINSLLFS